MSAAALLVRHLGVGVRGPGGPVAVLRDLSFTLHIGECVGLLGESGCGKSTLARSLLRLGDTVLDPASRIELGARDLCRLDARALDQVRGREMAMIFQDPGRALDPVHTVGHHLDECLRLHGAPNGTPNGALVRPRGRRERRRRSLELLAEVGLSDPARRLRQYPHQLSGGMRQRVMIAMALAHPPRVLLADEPTTSLDLCTQQEVLALLQRLRREHGTAILLISHDLGVIAQHCDRVMVMDAGTLVETAPTEQLFARPAHPRTRAMLDLRPPIGPLPEGARLPTLDGDTPRSGAPTARRPADGTAADPGRTDRPSSRLELRGLSCRHPVAHDLLGRPRRWVHALDEVSLALDEGEAVGVLGESGSGKSTLARALLGLEPCAAGTLHLDGRAVDPASRADWRRLRSRVQLVFQDAGTALHPTRRIGDALAEVLRVHRVVPRAQVRPRVDALLAQVGLLPEHGRRRPHELSSGQRQRAGVARALAVQPRILVADEPVSSLDPSVRAQVLNLLLDLREQQGLGLLLMGHDLGAMEAVCDRVLVLLNGRVVERLPVADLRTRARHPYTRALVAAWPAPDPRLRPERQTEPTAGAGEPITAFEPLRSCPFVPRCPRARAECSQAFPASLLVDAEHEVACLYPHDPLEAPPRSDAPSPFSREPPP